MILKYQNHYNYIHTSLKYFKIEDCGVHILIVAE